jgi:tRNA pseudouridine55 synthase
MGDYLGCGAHLTALRRTKVGHLQLKDACTLPVVKEGKAHLMSVDALVSTLPSIVLNEELSDRLCLGQRIPQSDAAVQPGVVRVYRKVETPQSFLGTVEVKNGVLHPRRLLAQTEPTNSVI